MYISFTEEHPTQNSFDFRSQSALLDTITIPGDMFGSHTFAYVAVIGVANFTIVATFNNDGTLADYACITLPLACVHMSNSQRSLSSTGFPRLAM